MLKQFKVKDLYIICSIDIMKESWYIQVLKVWDILPLEDIPKLAIRLDALFGKYANDYLNRCKTKCFDGYVHFLYSGRSKALNHTVLSALCKKFLYFIYHFLLQILFSYM